MNEKPPKGSRNSNLLLLMAFAKSENNLVVNCTCEIRLIPLSNSVKRQSNGNNSGSKYCILAKAEITTECAGDHRDARHDNREI